MAGELVADGLAWRHRGDGPVVINVPHAGTAIPPAYAERMTEAGRAVPDTDWYVDALYRDAAAAHDATLMVATQSRYVVDLNRDPGDRPLYSGRRTTELCPTSTFDDAPIYQPGAEPDGAEIAARRHHSWQPYHDALAAEIARVQAKHGIAVLFDAHSIRSQVPRFFDGVLPTYNLGTADGQSCAPDLAEAVMAVLAERTGTDWVRDGTFRGGYITRTYGRPESGCHALQMELAQVAYIQEAPPWPWRSDRAAMTIPILRAVIAAVDGWARAHAPGA